MGRSSTSVQLKCVVYDARDRVFQTGSQGIEAGVFTDCRVVAADSNAGQLVEG